MKTLELQYNDPVFNNTKYNIINVYRNYMKYKKRKEIKQYMARKSYACMPTQAVRNVGPQLNFVKTI